ncbi:hypothetical protein [Streptomyces sp. NPDC086519]|uniref:GbsR/MarR family transcriptional regulator n=1 Tax=Streptomyces sp. NPDC086519 TaxID=3154863 RepID=UPI003425925B
MPQDARLLFAVHVGRFGARHYDCPPMAGRLLGYLLVCDPAQQTIDELREALLASRSAITGTVKLLKSYDLARRTRSAGERMDRVSLNPTGRQPQNFDATLPLEHAALFREGRSLTLRRSAVPHSKRWSRWRSSSPSACPRCGSSGMHTARNCAPPGNCLPGPHRPLSPDDTESPMTSESNPSYQSDVAALRERVDSGDADAADELIELATEQSDMGELRRLAETGNSTAADQLIELATEQGDLAELRRLADQGNTTAAEVLDELLDE